MSTTVVYTADPSDRLLFSLSEVCERCGLHAEIIVEMVEHGIVAPVVEQSNNSWQFSIEALLRLNRAQRLRQDLEINLPGLALSLDLLDQIETLQQELAALRTQLRQVHEK
jgi:chaperone modulatory protein CbpM